MKNDRPPALFRCSIPTDPASAAVIQHLREQGLICADHRLRRGAREIVALLQSEISLLEEAGVDVEILTEPRKAPRRRADAPPADAIATGFVSAYLDSPGIESALADLHASFPALTTLTDLPETTTGYDGAEPGLGGPSAVKLFRITTTPAVFSKPGLLIVAGLHAREWMPPLAAIEFASQLLNNYDPASLDPDVIAVNAIVESIDVLIVAAANPDGIDYSRHDDFNWRKNRRPNGGAPSCPGVDLNRNFSIYWGEAGSSPDPCHYQVYRGPSAFSEAENRNIRHIVEQFPNILIAVDCHSYGEDFLRPQPGGGAFIAAEPVPPADDTIYTDLETSMNVAVAAASPGKSYATGTTSNHAGTFDEYMYFGHRIFGFELEIGEEFQPADFADAEVSIQEAASVMRTLAHEALNLSTRFITPVAIVQVIDRSGSMISSGYVDTTRGNAQRLIDLMSLNDSTAVVSFSGTAATELPLTPILSAGDYAVARAAVSGIAFGGSTSIGAGLERGLTLLPPPGAPRSILLLSDGFQNTDPPVESILPTVPAGVPVHTVALGLASDQVLLQHIAAETGGTYFYSPDEAGLFEIYNVAHAELADHEMLMGNTVSLPGGGGGDAHSQARSFSRPIVVDCDVDYVDVSVAAHQSNVKLDASLHSLSVPLADLGRVQQKNAPGYVLLRLKRPQPGFYRLTVDVTAAGPVTCSVAAYAKSPLRLHFDKIPTRVEMGMAIDLPLTVLDSGGKYAVARVSVSAAVQYPLTSVNLLAQRWKKSLRPLSEKSGDDRHDAVTRALTVLEHDRSSGKEMPQYIWKPVHLVHPRLASRDASMLLRVPTSRKVDGTYNVRLSVGGQTAAGCRFTRFGFRSVRVG